MTNDGMINNNGIKKINTTSNTINKTFYTRDKLRKSPLLKSIIKGLNSGIIKLDTDRKKAQKVIIKEYINFIRSFEDDKLFEGISRFVTNRELEKIILFARYNKNLNNSDFVKAIKKTDLSLKDLILCGHDTAAYKVLCTFEDELSKPKSDIVNRNPRGSEKSIWLLEVVSATIDVIKAIKYNYNNAAVSYFDEDDKDRKIFKEKRLYSVKREVFFFINENALTIDGFINYLSLKYPSKDRFTLEELKKNAVKYFVSIRNNSELIDDEFAKLILDKNYKTYISNTVNNLSNISKSLISINAFIYRKVLLPKSGVLLLVQDNDIIESILLKEVFKYDCNHIVAITRFKNGKELANIFTLNKKPGTKVHYLEHVEEGSSDSYYAIDYIMNFLLTAKSSVDKDKQLKYEVISPTYWKYRDRGYKSENDTTNSRGVVVKREFEIEIAPFLRKIKGTASSDAQVLAKKLGIVLENGHTIVKPHTRHYNTQK